MPQPDRMVSNNMRDETFDALILDLMLPDMDGLDVCRQIRTKSAETPIVMLTARGDAMDRIVGSRIGGRRLFAEALRTERTCWPGSKPCSGVARAAQTSDTLRFGRLEIDRAARPARVEDKPADLTSYQFNLLLIFAEHAGRVMSRDYTHGSHERRSARQLRPFYRCAPLPYSRSDRGRS